MNVNDLIEKLRSVKWEVTDDCGRMPDDPTHKCVFVDMRPDDFEALLTEAAAALEAAREDACVALVADIRFACGDNGKRSQPELVEYIRGLARDAARYRWLRQGESDAIATIKADTLDAVIDAAMSKEGK